MATLDHLYPTLLDFAKSIDPDGKPAKVAEVLSQYNEILDDMVWQEGNLPTGHQVTVRKTVGDATFRLFNQGVSPRVSTTGQIVETCAMMEDRSEIDVDLAKLNGNVSGFRMQQQIGLIESFNQTLSKALIYGDVTVNPERFNGLVPRYAALTGGATTNGQCIDAGGTSNNDNTSIYLVGWAPHTVFGIFPKGSQAGLVVQDLGEQTVFDSSQRRLQVYATRYQWKPGLAIADYRYVVRIANIKYSDLITAGKGTDTSPKLLTLMSNALELLYSITDVRPVFYCNKTVKAAIRAQLATKSNNFITLEDYQVGAAGFKRPTLMFQGFPVRRCDQILNTEAAIS